MMTSVFLINDHVSLSIILPNVDHYIQKISLIHMNSSTWIALFDMNSNEPSPYNHSHTIFFFYISYTNNISPLHQDMDLCYKIYFILYAFGFLFIKAHSVHHCVLQTISLPMYVHKVHVKYFFSNVKVGCRKSWEGIPSDSYSIIIIYQYIAIFSIKGILWAKNCKQWEP